MGRPQNIETREKILAAACGLFHAHGYKAVSMDDVAEAVGIKKANLFHYYPTKEHLGAAALDCVTGQLEKKLKGQFAQSGSPAETVKQMFADASNRMKKQGCCRGCIIGNLAQELSDHHEKLRRKIADYLQFWVNEMAGMLDRHRRTGYFRKEMKPRQAAQAILALLEGSLIFAKANKKVDALDDAESMALGYLKSFRK